MKRMGLARGLLAFLLLPGISLGLGLGDVHLNSPLNAPLDAEIELVNATPEDLATLEAKLATKETFARYGLDWPQFMSGVTVTRRVVRLSSFTLSRPSRCCTSLVTVPLGRSSDAAALVKVPASTTRANTRID